MLQSSGAVLAALKAPLFLDRGVILEIRTLAVDIQAIHIKASLIYAAVRAIQQRTTSWVYAT